jgi:creatinine amidohydrolase/Fe(II)-dependent formamide hydrolase-like protein
MKLLSTVTLLATMVPSTWAQNPAAPAPSPAPAAQNAGRGRGRGNGQPRPDMATIPRPIDMHDTVWIEDMTQLEIRDSLKAGKTTALVFAGGMEDNGPYVTVSQHNSIVRAMCDSIARRLGNALCAPIVGMAPGAPDRAANPGSVVLSADTFKGMLADIGTSLKTEGFQHMMFMTDHGADARSMQEAAKALSEKWAGSGATASYVAEYYDYNEVEKFEHDVLKVTEVRDGYHDDYYTASISVAIDPNGARMPERIKAHKTTINGVDLAIPKAAEDGKKIMAFREEATVQAIRKLVPAN